MDAEKQDLVENSSNGKIIPATVCEDSSSHYSVDAEKQYLVENSCNGKIIPATTCEDSSSHQSMNNDKQDLVENSSNGLIIAAETCEASSSNQSINVEEQDSVENSSNESIVTAETCEASSSHLQVGQIPRKERVKLYEATLKGDWNAAATLITANESLVRSQITDGGEIALHIAALQGHEGFVRNLLGKMEDDDVNIVNKNGSTSLCFAAAAGHTHIARAIVDGRPDLAKVKRGETGILPLYMAALQGFQETADFLYPLSDIGSWPQKEQSDLLTTAISSQLYGLAAKIVNDHSHLVIAKDSNKETPLLALARSPLAFRCNDNHQSLWARIRRIGTRSRIEGANERNDAYSLLEHVWEAVECIGSDIEADRRVDIDNSFFAAAESGNQELVVELLKLDHNLKYKINESKHSILHIAVLRRYDKVFSWMNKLGGVKDLIITYMDDDDNNILHLAGKLAPQNQLNNIPGAALQMQREVAWYKNVEKLVPPSFKNTRNRDGQMPHEVFLSEHSALMKDGENFMRQTANSCMIVSTIITTVVFTAAFTVPGSYNNKSGLPILRHKAEFRLFVSSQVLAMLSSLSSILMFLLILTSRYADYDFLRRLPLWLVLGVASLFVSVVAMVMAFCSSLLFYEHGWVAAALLISFAIVPTIFLILKYHLLVTIIRCTYNSIKLFPPRH